MFISHKSNVLQIVHDAEWQCRRMTKGQSKSEYWTWLATITDADGVVDYSGETGYTIVECTDEDVQERLTQLSDYVSITIETGIIYNIKYYATKRDSEIDGVKSHFIGDDTAKDKRILADEWTQIRTKRDRLLTESDWTQANDTPLSDADVAKWKTYRTSLRDLPSDQSSKTKYSDITWPTKP